MVASLSRLSENDIQTLISGQIITDIPSIVKELIENALDADASSITIGLDSHGLDRITVKDNGRGIPQIDREHLAKKHYTSKLSSLADLGIVRSYGFRGEALFSLAELCQSFKITTRTAEERVSTTFELNSRSELKAVKASSELPGTTVAIGKPWYKIPVRREKFRREVSKIGPKIRNLINVYALIHPSVRFYCTIKSGNKGEQPGTISRLAQKSVMSALANVFSPTIVDACTAYQYSDSLLELNAVLPSSTTNSSVSGKGAFVYVDKRPMNCARGLLKHILAAVRSRVAEALPSIGKDPLILLDIRCPPNSYDPNVEPQKDMIFWHDSDAIFHSINLFLVGKYLGVRQPEQSEKPEDIPSCHIQHQIGISAPTPRLTAVDYSTDIDLESTTRSDICSSMPAALRPQKYLTNHSADTQLERKGSWKYSMFDDENMETQVEFDLPNTRTSDVNVTNADELMANSEVDDLIPDRPSLNNPWTLARQAVKKSTKLDQATEARDPSRVVSTNLSQVLKDVNFDFDPVSITKQDKELVSPTQAAKNSASSQITATSGPAQPLFKTFNFSDRGQGVPNSKDVTTRNDVRKIDGKTASSQYKRKAATKANVMVAPQASITRYLGSEATLVREIDSELTSQRHKRVKLYDVPSRVPDDSPFEDSSHTLDIQSGGLEKVDLVSCDNSGIRGRASLNERKEKHLSTFTLERTSKEEQVHHLTVYISTSGGEELLRPSQQTDLAEMGAHLPRNGSLKGLSAIRPIARLPAGMLLLRAINSDNRTLAIFAASQMGIGARSQDLLESDCRVLQTADTTDGLVRLW